MKLGLSCVSFLTLSLCAACSSSAGMGASNGGAGGQGHAGGPSAGTGGSGTGGATAQGGAGSNAGGAAQGGAGSNAGGAAQGDAGSIAGGATQGGAGGLAAGGTAGSGVAGGAAGGGANAGFHCPAGPFTFSLPTAKAEPIAGAPPEDAFNLNNFTNVEGPVWIGDSLYFSEMQNGNTIPLSRILKLGPGNQVSVAVADSGSNGLAVDSSGVLWAAVHKDGSVSRVTLPSGPVTPVITSYQGKRFNSPNDLAIRSDGTIYFSDPDWQNSADPQPAQLLYWVNPAGVVTAIPARNADSSVNAPPRPNGVTLSPDETTLYVTGSGFKKFPVMADGSLGPGTDFVAGGDGDGMAADCAGNIYVAGPSGHIDVYSPAAAHLGQIMLDGSGQTTNVAFGGADHQTLYITVQGTQGSRGVFSVTASMPGFPY